MRKLILGLLVIGVVGFLALRWLVQLVSPRPEKLGVENGRLTPCPPTPNCVSTFEQDRLHGMAPIRYEGETADAHQRILEIIATMPRSTIIYTDPTYIHAEFRSFTWGFVDDVEFYFDETNHFIHFRAAARLGRRDFGANRQRMEQIREKFRE